ncbi:hypothetical protein R5R35_004218 [Gryllus longicercus]|uniref:Uncharacterized protein n=1 Tax=Gryllus longicercus TaxID=2509291 RepID=A0AAN9Z925_9ORTH
MHMLSLVPINERKDSQGCVPHGREILRHMRYHTPGLCGILTPQKANKTRSEMQKKFNDMLSQNNSFIHFHTTYEVECMVRFFLYMVSPGGLIHVPINNYTLVPNTILTTLRQ